MFFQEKRNFLPESLQLNHVKEIWSGKNKKRENKICYLILSLQSGGEESRTPVQTYSSKAFYMLILF